MTYVLWYWPGLPGRGEFIRLPLEAAGIAYSEPARAADDGFKAVQDHLESMAAQPAFAVPLLETGTQAIAQVSNILDFLVEEHGLGPADARSRRYLNQLQCDMADLTEEEHSVHHPVATSAYYEDQKDAAQQAAKAFREERIPKYLSHLEAAARASDGDWLMGAHWSTGDMSVAYLLDGLHYAFPQRMAGLSGEYPALERIRTNVSALDAIAAYRASDRWQPFGENGIFRDYPELDAA